MALVQKRHASLENREICNHDKISMGSAVSCLTGKDPVNGEFYDTDVPMVYYAPRDRHYHMINCNYITRARAVIGVRMNVALLSRKPCAKCCVSRNIATYESSASDFVPLVSLPSLNAQINFVHEYRHRQIR